VRRGSRDGSSNPLAVRWPGEIEGPEAQRVVEDGPAGLGQAVLRKWRGDEAMGEG
jgi:hypothetical protein